MFAIAPDHSTPQPSSNLSISDFAVPNNVIADFLGLGLAYSEWPAEVEKRDYVWYPRLEKIIIEKEWELFKPEIQRLRSEPKIAQSSRSKSNSLASILKRLKGESWVEGRPDEREERLRTRRLLGKDAKIRCLQKYVHNWDQEAAFSTSELSTQKSTTKVAAKSAQSQRTVPDNPGLEIDPRCGPSDMRHFSDIPDPEDRLTVGNVEIDTNALHLINNYPSQISSSIAPLSTQADLFSITAGDRDLQPAFQNVFSLPAETSGRLPDPELCETLNTSPAFCHDTTMAFFNHSPICEDDVPISADYNLGFDQLEPEPDIFKWMEMNQVSESFEPAETEAPGPDLAFQGTFLSPRNSFDAHEYLVFEETGALTTRSTTEGMSVGLARQQNSRQGCQETLSHPTLLPRSSSKSRKRRRQNTSAESLGISGCGNAITPATSHVASNDDTMMSGHESGSQHTDELVSQGSWTQMPPLSRPLSTPPWSGMTPKPVFTHIRTQIELELELQRTREELNSVKKQHKKELGSFIRKLQTAEVEISELREKVQEMQASTEYQKGIVHGRISENIILKENSRTKSVSSLPPTSTKDRERITKLVQSSNPSKNPRPLSLTLRPAIAGKACPPPRKLSTSTLQDTATLRMPITANSSSRLDLIDNSPISSKNPVTTHVAYKSTGRRYRLDSADSGQVSYGQAATAPSASKYTDQSNRPGSADTITAPNLGTCTRREPKPLQQFKYKFSNPFLRKHYHIDSDKVVQVVPTLPPLEASVPLDKQMPGVLINHNKQLTNDSGYGSLRFETGSRASIADAE